MTEEIEKFKQVAEEVSTWILDRTTPEEAEILTSKVHLLAEAIEESKSIIDGYAQSSGLKLQMAALGHIHDAVMQSGAPLPATPSVETKVSALVEEYKSARQQIETYKKMLSLFTGLKPGIYRIEHGASPVPITTLIAPLDLHEDYANAAQVKDLIFAAFKSYGINLDDRADVSLSSTLGYAIDQLRHQYEQEVLAEIEGHQQFTRMYYSGSPAYKVRAILRDYQQREADAKGKLASFMSDVQTWMRALWNWRAGEPDKTSIRSRRGYRTVPAPA